MELVLEQHEPSRERATRNAAATTLRKIERPARRLATIAYAPITATPAAFAAVKPASSPITPAAPRITNKIGGITATVEPSTTPSVERNSGQVGRRPVPIIVPR